MKEINTIEQVKNLPDDFYREKISAYPPATVRPLFLAYCREYLEDHENIPLVNNTGLSIMNYFSAAINAIERKKCPAHPVIAEVQAMLRKPAKNKSKYAPYSYHEHFDRNRDHPVCAEINRFFSKVDKAQRSGLPAVLALQAHMNGPDLYTHSIEGRKFHDQYFSKPDFIMLPAPIKKANGKEIPPAPKAKKPISRPIVTGLPVVSRPEVIIKDDVITVRFLKFPGWTMIKWFRANNYKWNPRKYYHQTPLTAESLNKITDLIGG